jgi:hypothetical protein
MNRCDFLFDKNMRVAWGMYIAFITSTILGG